MIFIMQKSLQTIVAVVKQTCGRLIIRNQLKAVFTSPLRSELSGLRHISTTVPGVSYESRTSRHTHNIVLNQVRHKGRRREDEDAFAYSKSKISVAYFIADEDWALKVIEALDLLNTGDNNAPLVFLPNPGDSPLTRLLLEMTKCPVVSWEPRENYYSHLQTIADDYKGRHNNAQFLFTKEKDFSSIRNDHFSHLKNESNVKVIGNIPDLSTYIPRMLFALSREDEFWKLGNVPHFLFVTGLEYRLMTEPDYFWANRIYQRTSLYKLFFDIKRVLEVPVGAFNRRLGSTSEKLNITYDKDNMYLVELKVRDAWFLHAPKTDLLHLIRLLKTISLKKGQRVIPIMEKWCPDIGLFLISNGIGMLDKIKDVPLDLWPLVYKALIENKHFPYSSMKHFLDGSESSRAAAKKLLDDEDENLSATKMSSAVKSES